MASENLEDDKFLAPIFARIAAWQAVIDSYLAAKTIDGPVGDNGAISASTSPAGSGAKALGTVQLPVGIFRDKPLKEAIPLYLEAGRRKQTNKEIALGLIAGGFPTTSDNFEATVGTALYRLKTDGVILRFPDGWDVAKSYPDSLRNRLEKDAKPKKAAAPQTKKGSASPRKAQTKKTGKAKRSRLRMKRAAAAKSQPQATAKGKGTPASDLEKRIVSYLESRKSEPSPVDALVGAVHREPFVIKLTLGRMAKKGLVTKQTDGRWLLADVAA